MDFSTHRHTGSEPSEWPTVTIVFLVYNRLRELRISLRRMAFESGYPPDRADVIVVDKRVDRWLGRHGPS